MNEIASQHGGAHIAAPLPIPGTRWRKNWNAAENALMDLVDAFRLGAISRGDRLPSLADMSDALGVSRSNVRKALFILETSGVVRVKAGRGGGTFVTDIGRIPWAISTLYPPVSAEEVPMLLEAWSTMEREVAIMASRRRTDEGIEKIRLKLVAMEEHQEPVNEFFERSTHFRLTVAIMAGNRFLRGPYAELMDRFAFISARRGYFTQLTPDRFADNLRSYQQLHWGIANGDEQLITEVASRRLALALALSEETESTRDSNSSHSRP